MIVFYTASRNLYPHLQPPIASLLDHNPDIEKIYVLCEDDSLGWDTPKQVECINVANQTTFPPDGPNYRTGFSYVTLSRAVIADLVPKKYDRIIQLDADTIINDSLQELWNMDLGDYWLAAVPENELHTQHAFEEYDERYFNVGTAVLNLKQIRKDKVTPELIEALNTIYMPWIDQDAWNYLGLPLGKIMELPVRWNESKMTGETDNPGIVHYCCISEWWKNHAYHRRDFWRKYRAPLS